MYVCNVTFMFSSIETESWSMCSYFNYHMVMLVVCGSISVVFVLMALFSLVFHVAGSQQTESIEKCVRWALIMLFLSLGFDGAFALFYLLFFVMIFVTAVNFCFTEAPRVISHTARRLVSHVNRRPNAVAAVEMGMHDVQVVVVVDIQQECPICLEMDNGPWKTTRCGHTFHTVCIRKWTRDTCPLCRCNM